MIEFPHTRNSTCKAYNGILRNHDIGKIRELSNTVSHHFEGYILWEIHTISYCHKLTS